MMKITFSPTHTFFTSDTHFFHSKVIRYCNRPFQSVEQMNEVLIENWNSVVKKKDTVFHLGDFCFGSPAQWNDILDKLNGKIHLIIGNHDQKVCRKLENRFESISMQMYINIDGQIICFNHYPFLCYSGSGWKVWQLHGHIHINSDGISDVIDKSRMDMLLPGQYDVGVDNNNFTLVSFDKVKDCIFRQFEKLRDTQ